MQHLLDTKRIAKNTVFLYLRSILVMAVSIYSSRIILQQLGVENYGIYNVVGGVVGLFSMFSATFVSVSQRFLSYSLGCGSLNDTREVFSISVRIHLCLAITLFIIVELIGGWYLGKYMNIPVDRMNSAYIVFHISNLTFIINLISIPYNALIIAKERMSVFAYVSVFEAFAKLGVAFLLSYSRYDKLIEYSCLILLISLSVRFFYGLYCRRNFQESRIIRVQNKRLYRDFLSFSGWNFIGSSTSILRINGNNLILNYFCGVAVNASRALATQVQSAVMQLVSNFMTAMNPQIIKSYSVGNNTYVNNLVLSGSKIGFYLVLFISLPIIYTSSDVLKTWLGNVPPYTNAFLILVLVNGFLNPFTTLLDTLLSACGHIKHYQIQTSIATLLSLPILGYVLHLGAEPYMVYIIGLALGIVNLTIRILNCRKYVEGFELSFYLKKVVVRSIIVLATSIVAPLLFRIYFYNSTFFSWILQCVIIEISLILSVWFIGLNQTEKEMVKNALSRVLGKIFRIRNR